MANLTKFFDKAKLIYAAMKAVGTKGRNGWNEAQRQASLYFKALRTGVVTFMKLDGTITTRTVESIELHYEFKGSSQNAPSNLVKLWDTVKNSIISFHAWQIVKL
jgi:hypothetical protein